MNELCIAAITRTAPHIGRVQRYFEVGRIPDNGSAEHMNVLHTIADRTVQSGLCADNGQPAGDISKQNQRARKRQEA